MNNEIVPERVNCLGKRQPHETFAMDALAGLPLPTFLALVDAAKAKQQEIKPHEAYVNVVLTIDGVQVSFSETLNRVFGQLEEEVKRRAEARAVEIVTLSNMEPLIDAISDVKKQVADRFRRAGFQLDHEIWS